MQFRIISDLHTDINKKYYSKFKFDPNAFYLIAGDIAGSRYRTEKFLNYHGGHGLNNCIFIEGNHMGYDFEYDTHDQTKEACYAYLAEKFPLTSNISFMNNDVKEIGEDTVVIGCTLYTNYELFGDALQAMVAGARYLNDFRYVHTYSNLGDDRLVLPSDYLNWHEKSMAFITEMCEKYKDKKIIMLTHHGVSSQSLTDEYKNDIVSASYVSNLEPFILAHPQIKLWCHGHTHNKANYKIGETQVICNPFGYWNENKMKMTRFIGEVYEL